MTIDLFAGIPVRDYGPAAGWYERLLGTPPSFLPNYTEAVWELTDHGHVYIAVRPEHAGHALHTVFVSDFDARIAQIPERGLEPAARDLRQRRPRGHLRRPGRQRDRIRRRSGLTVRLTGSEIH